MASDFQGGLQLAIAAALLVTSGKEKPLPPQAFGPELEPVVDLALPLSEVFIQHLAPCVVSGLCVQWVHVGLLKQRRAQVSWLIPILLSKVFPEYFTSFSMTQPGPKEQKELCHLRIQTRRWQEWRSQIQEKFDQTQSDQTSRLRSPPQ